MKNYKYLAAAAVVGLTVMGIYTILSNSVSDYSNYQEALLKARESVEKDVMEEAIGTEDVKGFCLCNAFKYIYRCCKKNTSPLEDVKKAVWYLNKFIEIEERNPE